MPKRVIITAQDLLKTPAGQIPANKKLLENEINKNQAIKPNKYRNKKTVVDGITFDSKKEAGRYRELLMLKNEGLITGLELQKTFQLSVCKYEADFVYWQDGKMVVEDVKSRATKKLRPYIMKKKMMLNELNIEIKEV